MRTGIIVWVSVLLLYATYACLSLSRRALQNCIAALLKHEIWPANQIARFLTAQHLAYSLFQFVVPFVQHRLPHARTVLCSLLFATALLLMRLAGEFSTVGRAESSSSAGASPLLEEVTRLGIAFSLGTLVSAGWPTLVQVLTGCVAAQHFGFTFSLLSTASSLAGVFGPYLSLWLAPRSALFAISSANLLLLFAVLLPCFLLVPGGAAVWNVSNTSSSTLTSASTSSNSDKSPSTSPPADKNSKSRRSLLTLLTPVQLSVCLIYFGVSLLRHAVQYWFPALIISRLGTLSASSSSSLSSLSSHSMSCMDLGGICGNLLAGIISDRAAAMHRNAADYATGSSAPPILARFSVLCAYATGAVFSLAALLAVVWQHSSAVYGGATGQSPPTLVISGLAFVFGLLITGPVSLSSIIAIQAAHWPELRGPAQSFTTLSANLGVLIASSTITTNLASWLTFGWLGVLSLYCVFCGVAVAIGASFTFLHSARSRSRSAALSTLHAHTE